MTTLAASSVNVSSSICWQEADNRFVVVGVLHSKVLDAVDGADIFGLEKWTRFVVVVEDIFPAKGILQDEIAWLGCQVVCRVMCYKVF